MRGPVGGWDHELFPDGLYAQVPDEPAFNNWRGPAPPAPLRPLSFFADPLELTFSTPEELEQRILRAVGDDAWRRRHGGTLARRARDTVSMTRFASRLLELVAGRVRDVAPQATEPVR